MSNLTWSMLIVACGVGLWMYRRARAPDLLNEIRNGLIHLAFRDNQRGEAGSAQMYQRMADAIERGQTYLVHKQVEDLDDLKATSRLVLHSMDYAVLEACGIHRQNHKHACYEAAGDLAKRLDKLIERQSHST